MISAVVLLNTDLNSQNKVLENLKLVTGVEEAHELCGVYDFLVKIKAASLDEIKNISKIKLKQVSGVTSALTLMINDTSNSMHY